MSQSTYKAPVWHPCKRLNGGRKVVRDESLREGLRIYHFLPWPYALMIFQQNRLRLSPVMSWTDPYEKAWCDLLFQGEDKLTGVSAYGLCWTKSKYDEPLWRMAAFNRREPLVRISCRVESLVDAGCKFIERNAGSLYLGNVAYRPENSLHEQAKNVLKKQHQDTSPEACKLLLQKRNAFRFENEVRLLWFDRAPARNELFLPIDTSTAIIQIMTSPYATDDDHQKISAELEPFGVRPIKSGILWKPKFAK